MKSKNKEEEKETKYSTRLFCYLGIRNCCQLVAFLNQSVNYLRVNTYKEFFNATLKLICNECSHVFFVVVSLSGSSIVFDW